MRTRRCSRLGLATLLCALAAACGRMGPASFEVVELDTASALVVGGEIDLLLAVGDPAHEVVLAPSWAPSETDRLAATDSGSRSAASRHDGASHGGARAVLVVAARSELGYRSAAEVARSGRRPVLLVIASREADRQALVALAHSTEVTADGQDS